MDDDYSHGLSGIAAYDSGGPYEEAPRVFVELMPDTWGRWFYEVHSIALGDCGWTHHYQRDGHGWTFRAAVRKAIQAGADLYFSDDFEPVPAPF